MLEGEDTSRLLDILGNRNRRRIIQLLRLKPCFVTEISDRLMISPKAVIEHLQMMERENVLLSHSDERRRKYYFLSQDIDVRIKFHQQKHLVFQKSTDNINIKFQNSLGMLKRLIVSRDNLITNLEYLERDIDQKINELMRLGKEILPSEDEIQLVITLSSSDLTIKELEEWTNLSNSRLKQMLENLIAKGIIEQREKYYKLREKYDNKSQRRYL